MKEATERVAAHAAMTRGAGSLVIALALVACATGARPAGEGPGQRAAASEPWVIGEATTLAGVQWQELVEPGEGGGTVPLVAEIQGRCEAGESAAGGLCLWLETAQDSTYAAATTLCAARGGRPAAALSASINSILFGLMPTSIRAAWIGLGRDGAGSFGWDSGQPLTYANWAPGEPNNETGDEQCVIMWGPGLTDHPDWQGQWNDAPCTAVRHAVLCERQP